MPEGIEVVELSDVDLEFAVEEMFREGGHAMLDETRIETAKPNELAALELFQGVDPKELTAIAPRCQFIQAIPGYVLLSPGRLNSKVFFVVEGQLRMYAPTNDKRPIALVDVGHSTGLRSALRAQAADHSVISTEMSHVIVIEMAVLEELAKRVNGFAQNYAQLLASYVRGDNCMYIGPSAGRAGKPGFIDELTLLHNQHWLDNMFPRLVGRYRLSDNAFAVVAFRIDKLNEIIKEHSIGPGLRVLEAVGRWTLNQTRPTDILAVDKDRTIFAFLPDCDLNAARQLGNRLKTELKTLAIPLGSPKAPQPISVTISVGITVLEKGMKETDFLADACALLEKSISLGGDWMSEKPAKNPG